VLSYFFHGKTFLILVQYDDLPVSPIPTPALEREGAFSQVVPGGKTGKTVTTSQEFGCQGSSHFRLTTKKARKQLRAFNHQL